MMDLLDLDNAELRWILKTALADIGIEAKDSVPGEGMHALEVILLPDDGQEALSAVALSMDTPCQIGLSGYRFADGTMIECGTVEMLNMKTVAQAVDTVKVYVEGKDTFINNLRAGRYDF